jgi:RimJ/RimL family protein N-acetyltransferase
MAEIPWPDPPLRKRAVGLRAFRPEDADQVYQACQDAEIARFTVTLPWPYEHAHAVTWIAGQDHARREGTGIDLAVEAPDGEFAGAIGLNSVDESGHSARVGYWVARWARAQGVATAALNVISGWALGAVGLRLLTLDTAPENVPSQRIAEHAGYRFSGEVPDVHGKFPSVRRYILTA